jgi:hypothetical protein
LLIGVRHTSEDLARVAAPELLSEAQRHLAVSLMSVSEDIAFYQAVLVLSLWSTTVGQVPMTTDGWLLTTYAITHSLSNTTFNRLLRNRLEPLTDTELDAFCIWNHLCLAHLQ